MQREILFRSWSDFFDEFFYFKNGKYFEDVECEKESNNNSRYKWSNSEQYTGLNDKNGVKIFEGDKIKYDDVTGVVLYNDDICMFLVRFQYTRSTHDFDFLEREIEVIGNIHDE